MKRQLQYRIGHIENITATEMQDDTVEIELRSTFDRPVHKLSVRLIDTYKLINKIYYEAKAQKLREQKDTTRVGVHNDGFDDQNYDYILRGDEIMNDRYILKHKMGKGSFGQVVCAYDQERKAEVAIKIIKSRKPFLIQAKTEIDILNKISEKDEGEDSNIVRLLDHFMYRNHQCLVFEILSFNLYELLKNTKFRGVSLSLIRKFSRHLLKSLEFLSRPDVDIIHCDLKPENILLRNPRRSAIKLIDFGSSCYLNKRAYSYIQSRFYRSPEVLLGLPYTQKIDMWSLGCVCVEMHTGEPLFGGANQADQICRIVDILGMPPAAMIRSSPERVRSQFFERVVKDSDLTQLPSICDITCTVTDETEGVVYVLKRPNKDCPKPRSLEDIIGVYTSGPSGRRAGEPDHTVQKYTEFLEFVRAMLVYDPSERAAASDLLCHEYILSVPEGGIVPVAAPPTSSSTLATPGATLSTNTLHANDMYYAAKLASHASTNGTGTGIVPSDSMQTSATADGDAGNESINSKDVLRNRRTDIPNTTTKVRSQSAPSGATSVRLFSSQPEIEGVAPPPG